MPSYPKPKAVVLTDDGVFYDSGRHHQLNDRMDLSDLAAVLSGASRALRGEEGVILLDRKLADLNLAGISSWVYSQLRAWTTFSPQKGQPGMHVGFLPELADARGRGPLLRGTDDPRELAWRLGRYHELLGVPWRYTAGVTGCSALRARFTDPGIGRQPLWHYTGPKGMRGSGPLVWTSRDQPRATDPGNVLVFDVNAMYLAALRNAQLAWGRLEPHTGGFDAHLPGWWELDVADLDPGLYDGVTRPPVFPRSHIHKGAVWLSTEVVKYLAVDLSYSPVVLAAAVSTNRHPIGRGVAEQLYAARAEILDEPAPRIGPAIKRTYAELVGMVARADGSIHRTDWAVTWQDLARMNFFRRLQRAMAAGYLPIRIRTDGAYFYSTDAADLARLSKLLGVGTVPGTFKLEKILTVPEYLADRGAGRS